MRWRAGRPWLRRTAPGTVARWPSRSWTTARAAASSSALRRMRQQRRTAPAPAALPTERTPRRVRRAPGRARARRADRCGRRTRRPGACRRRAVDAGVPDQQIDARPQRRLGKLDRAHVVLSDRQLDVAGVGTARSGTCARRRRCRGALGVARRTTPSASITPARYISAITSMIPEPQMPVIADRRRLVRSQARRSTGRHRSP